MVEVLEESVWMIVDCDWSARAFWPAGTLTQTPLLSQAGRSPPDPRQVTQPWAVVVMVVFLTRLLEDFNKSTLMSLFLICFNISGVD